jgi:hypothetical protein
VKLLLLPLGRGDTKLDAPQEESMEYVAIVIVFALTLVAVVALGKGVRGKLGAIEIVTQEDTDKKSRKK